MCVSGGVVARHANKTPGSDAGVLLDNELRYLRERSGFGFGFHCAVIAANSVLTFCLPNTML